MSNFYETLVDKGLNIFFSKDKTKLYVLGIVVLALVLRLIAAVNLTVAADDMHFTVHAINFLNSGKLEVYDQSASLWYYITDSFYHIFGTTQLASRMAAVIFGSLSVIFMFLLGKEFFGKKAGLIAAFLLAISPYHIRNTLAEMDVLTIFFVLGALLFFIRALKKDSKKGIALSAVFLGLAIFTKAYALLFIPVMIAYALFENYKIEKSIINKKIVKILLVFLLIVFIFCLPALVHNYLLYKDKGYTDLLFATTLKIGRDKAAQFYSWDPSWDRGADYKGLLFGGSIHLGGNKIPAAIYALGFIFFTDPLVAILGSIGLIYCILKKNRKFIALSLFIFIFVYLYLAARILMSKHYMFLIIIFIPAAANLLAELNNKRYLRLKYLFAILILINLIVLGLSMRSVNYFYSESEVNQLMNYKTESIGKNSIIVADSRIYRGEIHWTLNGYNYIESAQFPAFWDLSEKTSGGKVPTDVYFVECSVDDCGWGTVSAQPEFNKSSEELVASFRNISSLQKQIYSAYGQSYYFPIISKPETTYFKIYKTTLNINPKVLPALKSTQTWFLYPIGYDESIGPIFDNYVTFNSFDALLDKVAHWVVYFSLIMAFISILISLYLLMDENET